MFSAPFYWFEASEKKIVLVFLPVETQVRWETQGRICSSPPRNQRQEQHVCEVPESTNTTYCSNHSHLEPPSSAHGPGALRLLSSGSSVPTWALLLAVPASSPPMPCLCLAMNLVNLNPQTDFLAWLQVCLLAACLVVGWCLTLVALTIPDPDLWMDFLSWAWSSLVTTNISDDLGSWLKPAAAPRPVLLDSPGAVGEGLWLVRPLTCCTLTFWRELFFAHCLKHLLPPTSYCRLYLPQCKVAAKRHQGVVWRGSCSALMSLENNKSWLTRVEAMGIKL